MTARRESEMLEGQVEFDRIEEQILEAKHELSSLSRERQSAAAVGRADKMMEARAKSIEKTLENCGLLVEYVKKFSRPIAREMGLRHERLMREFEHMKQVNSPDAFHEWIRSNMVPVVRQSEQIASLAATIVKKSQGERIDFHRWAKRQIK